MSERSVEDELVSETRKFMSSMSSTMRRYAQASNWLDRRKVRQEIKQAWRQELKQQQLDRRHQLSWTNSAVDKFRAHSLAVSDRANDPTVDHDRRYRDAQAIARHRNQMADRVLRNPHLTVVEQGIALDGIDAASVFPEFTTGDMFRRAHKVKRIEALRYRAQVARAREAAGIERPPVQAMRHVDRATEPDRTRFPAGDSQQDQAYRRWLTERDDPERSGQPPRTAEHDGRYSSTVTYLPEGANQVVYETSSHDSEDASARWTVKQLNTIRPAPGTTVHLAAYAEDRDGHPTPVFRAEGARSGLAKEVEQWQAGLDQARVQERGLAPNDDREREFSALKDRHRLSIQYNNALVERNGKQTADLAKLTTERDELAEELNTIRSVHKGTIAVAASRGREVYALVQERDQLREERDEAVRKLAERTPAEQRYGSPERQAAQARDNARGDQEQEQGFSLDSETRQRMGKVIADGVLKGSPQAEVAQRLAAVLAERTPTDHQAPAAEPVKTPIKGHAFAGLINGRDREQEPIEELAQEIARAGEAREESAGRSPLADYQPGHALADAVARNGRDREGMER
ncbi:hypothetical protein ACFQZZ_14560 [Nocardia sp. GCM10030253]|uniref:hypothetical protein n=1 Tax=Nocardia sp. GCM10030253 TaxID=3273404 RepID=UPI00362BC849